MTAMVSRCLRCPVGSGTALLGCALVMATALFVGCTRSVDGTVRAADGDARPAGPIPLSDLLIEPRRFPAQYPAVVLDPTSVYQAIRDIDGVDAGAIVTPPLCAPRAPGPSPQDAVAVQGVDTATSSSLTVAITRAATALSARRDQLSACPSFTTTAAERSTTVTATVLPPRPVDADDSLAVEQTTSTSSGENLRSLTLVAQIADVQVAAAWRTASADAPPETQSLDTLFTDAVLKVRRGGQP
jgi:hypothetical protein